MKVTPQEQTGRLRGPDLAAVIGPSVRPLTPTAWHVVGDVNWRDIRADPSDYCLQPALVRLDTEVGPRRTELRLGGEHDALNLFMRLEVYYRKAVNA